MPGELDTLYQLATPESIDLQAELAGPVSRALAFLIDLAIRAALMACLSIFFYLLDNAGVGLLLLAWFAVDWFYPVLFEVLRQGQTPGKKKMGLQVLHENLTPVGWNASLIRNLLRTVDFLPLGYLAGLVSMCLNDKFQRLGDIAAATVVVMRATLPEKTSLPDVRSRPAPIQLTLEEQVAIISFVQRSAQFSDARRIELAEVLSPVSNVSGKEGVNYWQGVGLWLLGES